jgi:probable HAF family extracellular repeat protein
VVGVSNLQGDNLAHAFLYQDGGMTDLNGLIPAGSGWVLSEALAINETGEIVGDGVGPASLYSHAFLLAPSLSLGVGASTDVSTVGAPEFAELSVFNNSPVPVYLQSFDDSFLGNLIAQETTPIAPVTNVNAFINGAPVTLHAGLALPARASLDVIVTRIVQATDPNPTFGTTICVFSANSDGTGTTVQGQPEWLVSIFRPSIMIGLSVDKTTANLGTRLTCTVTIRNTSTFNSPSLVANFQTGSLSNLLVSGASRGRVSGLLSTSHMFVGEFVFGPGLAVNSKIIAINSATQVTLNKPVKSLGSSNLFFGFGPAIVNGVVQHFVAPPSDFFTNNPALVAELENCAPGETIQFSYTHVITSADPNLLKNTLDMFFFVANDFELHLVAWPNRIHGPSITVTTAPLSLKMLF